MRLLLVAALSTLIGSAAVPATAAKPCGRVVNPYPDTRYDGVDLSRIRAVGVTCHRARRVARGAHRKALGLPLPPGGVRHYRWHRWKVTGDIRPASDRYVARLGDRRVSWRF